MSTDEKSDGENSNDPFRKKKKKIDLSTLLPVEDMPVLPDLKGDMDVDLVVKEDGKLYVFHERPLPEQVQWAEYDVDDAALFFVGPEGRIQNLGMTVHKPMRPYMKKAVSLYMVEVGEKGAKNIYRLPMAVRDTGL